MIKLDLFNFCDGCPRFEADVDKTTIELYYEVKNTDTIIRCKNREICKSISEYINRKLHQQNT